MQKGKNILPLKYSNKERYKKGGLEGTSLMGFSQCIINPFRNFSNSQSFTFSKNGDFLPIESWF